jgi:hypothetical protein
MVMPTADTGRPEGGPGQPRRLPRWIPLALGTSASVLSEMVLGYHYRALETISIACDVGLPTLLILVLVGTALFGSDDKQERAFRLLRWIRDKPEPPSPNDQHDSSST